jgi:hypothetical protein
MMNDRINRKNGTSEAMHSMQALRNVAGQFQVMGRRLPDSPESIPCTDEATATDFTIADAVIDPADAGNQDKELLDATSGAIRPASLNSTVVDH